MNIVIPYKKRKNNRKIYYCIDLIKKKYPNSDIYVIGDIVKREDVKNIYIPPYINQKNRGDDSCNKLLKYIEFIGQPFILFHDDIFITDFNFDLKCNYYSDTIENLMKNKDPEHIYYSKFLKLPQEYKHYDLHIPFIVENVELFKECILEAFENDTTLVVRSIYGNKLNDENDKDYLETFGYFDSKTHELEIRRPYHSLPLYADLNVIIPIIKKGIV